MERRERLAGFKESVPSLGFVYSDVYYDYGLLDRRLVDDYEASDLAYFVEWPYQSEERSVWSHWAVEKSYSPPNLMAYGSDVARFINNDIKDRWDNNKNISEVRVPSSSRLLMGADTTSWEGWMASETNLKYSEAIRKVFDNNIPTKYMQRNSILNWTRGQDNWVNHIWFENNVEAFFEGDVLNDNTRKRVITQNGKRVYEGTAKDGVNDSKYLIPWDIEENKQADGTYEISEKEGKLYHWNELGGKSTWELPDSWNGVKNVKVYMLTDQGKTGETMINVDGGKITLTAEKNVPYVVYKGNFIPVNKEVEYGKGSFVKDPGFNAAGTIGTYWMSEEGTQNIVKDQKANAQVKEVGYELEMGPGESAVSQEIYGLTPGQEYAVSVMTEVEKDKTRDATLEVQIGESNINTYTINVSKHMEANVMSTKAGTNMLPIRVTFTAPENDSVTIRLKAGMGDAKVKFDNVRVYATKTSELPEYADKDKTLIYQDFEYAPTGAKPNGYVVTQNDYLPTYEGYYPFFMAGGIREPKYIIEQMNAPYTQNGADDPWDKNTAVVDEVINGRNSFKVVGPSLGLFVATSPNTVKFEKGKEYRITFKYQASPGPDFAVAVGSVPNVIESYDILPETSKSTTYTKTFVANSDDQWVGFTRVAETDQKDPTPFVLDDILIEEIGAGVLQPGKTVPTYQVYEVENATLIEGSAGSDPMKVNSNGMVDFFQDIGDTIIFENINAAKDGIHSLTIDYSAGYNSRTATIIVNGSESKVKLPKTGSWGRPTGNVTVPVNLKEGNNTITFIVKGSNSLSEWDEGRYNLDCIRVSDANPHQVTLNVKSKIKPHNVDTYSELGLKGFKLEDSQENGKALTTSGSGIEIEPQPSSTRYEFEAANIINSVTGSAISVRDEANASGGKIIEKFGDVVGDKVEFEAVTVAKAGVYKLTFRGAHDFAENRKLAVKVNDGELQDVVMPKSGWFNYANDLTGLNVRLNAGINVISVEALDPVTNDIENAYGKVLLDYMDVELVTPDEQDPNPDPNPSEPLETATITFNNVNFKYGVSGISLYVKAQKEGRIEAYQNETKIGETSVGTDYTVKYIDFNKMISGYDSITLKFIESGENQYNIGWMQFSDMREAEDSFLVNGVQIRLGGNSSGRGYINEFETGVYNPAKDKREVKLVVESDDNQIYDMDIRYAVNGDRANAFTLKVNGQEQGKIALDSTGDWLAWNTATIPVKLSKGFNAISIGIDKDAAGNFVNDGGVNLDYFVLRPSNNAAMDANDFIDAENYDNAFGVSAATNNGVTYVNGVTNDSWIRFDNVKFNGTHDMLEFYMAGQSSGSIQLLIDDEDFGTFPIENGTNSSKVTVNLDKQIEYGAHKIVLKFQTDADIKLDGIRFINKVTSIILDEAMSLYVSEIGYINTQILPDSATYKNVVWTVIDPTVASVDQNGKVTGLKVGQTDVIATSQDGQASATCKVNISQPDWIDSYKFEAEDAVLSGGTKVNNNHKNYSGIGFVDGYFSTNYYAGAEFKYNAPEAGKYKIAIAYSLGLTDSKTTGLVINGKRLNQSLELVPTGGWANWKNHFIEVELQKGINTIAVKVDAMTYGDTGNFNLDYISVNNCTPVKGDEPTVE